MPRPFGNSLPDLSTGLADRTARAPDRGGMSHPMAAAAAPSDSLRYHQQRQVELYQGRAEQAAPACRTAGSMWRERGLARNRKRPRGEIFSRPLSPISVASLTPMPSFIHAHRRIELRRLVSGHITSARTNLANRGQPKMMPCCSRPYTGGVRTGPSSRAWSGTRSRAPSSDSIWHSPPVMRVAGGRRKKIWH